MEIEQEISELKVRLDQATRARSRAEFEKDAARASAEKAKQTLRDDFGVESVEEARDLLGRLREDLQGQVSRIKATLDGLS